MLFTYTGIFSGSPLFFFFPPSQAELKVNGGTVHFFFKVPRYFSLLLKYILYSWCRFLKRSQQAETRKAGKKPSFSDRREPGGGDGKICLYDELALFWQVLGLAEETQAGGVTFEPGPNE